MVSRNSPAALTLKATFREDYMRRWRTTKHENGVRIVSAVNLLFSVEAKVIFIAEDFTDGMRRPVSDGMRYAPKD
jgi:hypothetical protein